jgi:heterodisulfide reductase subunit A
MVAVGRHRNIELRTYAEVESVSGYVGNFKVGIKKKPRFVDLDKCTGCGSCWQNCLGLRVPTHRVIRKGNLQINQNSGGPTT